MGTETKNIGITKRTLRKVRKHMADTAMKGLLIVLILGLVAIGKDDESHV